VYRFLMLLAAATVLPLAGGAAQEDGDGLQQAAERARHAWQTHNPTALVAESPRLVVQLPGADPSVALGPAQAAALLGDFVGSSQEVETSIRAARKVGPETGYVELQRRYRVTGTQDIQEQVLLLSYRRASNRWRLVEFRVVG
jgi:hypothetical protein